MSECVLASRQQRQTANQSKKRKTSGGSDDHIGTLLTVSMVVASCRYGMCSSIPKLDLNIVTDEATYIPRGHRKIYDSYNEAFWVEWSIIGWYINGLRE